MFNHITKKNIILTAAIVLALALIALCGYYKSTEIFCSIVLIYGLIGATFTPVKLKNAFLKGCCKFIAFFMYTSICVFIFYYFNNQNAEIILVANDYDYSTSYCRVGAEYTYVDSNGVIQSIPIDCSKVYVINNSDRRLIYYSVEYSNILFSHYNQDDGNKQIIEPSTYKILSFYPDYLLCLPPQTIRSTRSSNTIKYVLMYEMEIPSL